MKKIRTEIVRFISELEKEYPLFRYIHNDKKGGYNPQKDTVFYSGPYWDMDEKVAILEAVLTGNWLSSGQYVHKFETDFSEYFSIKYSVMVNSGSSANLVMISALKKYFKWSDQDEIILSPVGFPTTLTPIIQNNLKPIFIDISLDDLNFDVNKIEDKITSKSKAIFLSPVLGNPPNMDALKRLAEKYKLELILDNCDSLGSRWDGKYLSEYCIASSTSFYPAHHITTGQGGMVSSNNPQIVKLSRSYSSWGGDCTCVGSQNLLANGSCGKRFGKWIDNYDGIIDHRYLFTHIGYNLKPLDLQGAIGIAQIKKFDEIHMKRRQNKELIQDIFTNSIEGLRIIDESSHAETSWFGVGIICKNRKIKESLVSYLEKNKIQTRNYFAGNLLMHPAFEEYGEIDCYPKANMVMERMFFVGCSPTISLEMIDHIKDVVDKYSSN